MSGDLIPERVREFIASSIDSIAELEALLLLRNNSQINWSLADLAARLYASYEQSDEVMARLRACGLVEIETADPLTFHYQPRSQELDETVAMLAETYSRYLVPVTNLIHSKPRSRVQQFADAFKLRRRRDE